MGYVACEFAASIHGSYVLSVSVSQWASDKIRLVSDFSPPAGRRWDQSRADWTSPCERYLVKWCNGSVCRPQSLPREAGRGRGELWTKFPTDDLRAIEEGLEAPWGRERQRDQIQARLPLQAAAPL